MKISTKLHLLAVVAAAGLSGCGMAVPIGSVQQPPVGQRVESGGVTDGHSGFAVLLNTERGDRGAQAVAMDDRLMRAAMGHARDIESPNYTFGSINDLHIGSDGSTVVERVQAQGYNPQVVSENVARGQGSEREVFGDWMDSNSHRDAMLDPRVEDFGMGVEGRTWVLLVGREPN